MKNGFFFVVNEPLAVVALIAAKKLRTQSNADIHIFIEDKFFSEFNYSENDRIFIHKNKLGEFLPKRMPSSSYWPEIVYLRIFAPFILDKYDRLLYLDADIIPLAVPNKIWDIQLSGPVGAVLDFGAIEESPVKKISKVEWLKSIGIQSDTYFNSGVLLIEVSSWRKINFTEQLQVFVGSYRGSIKMFDQDFLNWLFQDEWTDIGPAWNYQASIFGFGFEYLLNPVFLHFSKPEKPWLCQYEREIIDIDNVGSTVLMQMSDQYKINISHLARKKQVNFLSRMKYFIRAKLSSFGIITKKERMLRQAWEKRRRAAIRYVFAESNQFNVEKDSKALDMALSIEPVFDGKSLRFPITERMKKLLEHKT